MYKTSGLHEPFDEFITFSNMCNSLDLLTCQPVDLSIYKTATVKSNYLVYIHGGLVRSYI